MLYGLAMIICFVLGMALGLSLPKIIIKNNTQVEESVQIKPKTTADEVLDEWLNGK